MDFLFFITHPTFPESVQFVGVRVFIEACVEFFICLSTLTNRIVGVSVFNLIFVELLVWFSALTNKLMCVSFLTA